MDLRTNQDLMVACSSGSLGGSTPATVRKRRFSSAKIQPTRVKKVMQSDDEIGRMVASVPVAIGRAMEHFAEKFLEAAAQCVQYSTTRTLSPSHMKQAMLQNRHFAFLEPLMRDVSLPQSAPPELSFRTDWVDQQQLVQMNMPSGSGLEVLPSMTATMPQVQICPMRPPIAPALVSSAKRKSNGETEVNDPKPKRGRPRKVKREDKCIDDDELLIVKKAAGDATANGNSKTDRELMPPPSIVPMRTVANRHPQNAMNIADSLNGMTYPAITVEQTQCSSSASTSQCTQYESSQSLS